MEKAVRPNRFLQDTKIVTDGIHRISISHMGNKLSTTNSLLRDGRFSLPRWNTGMPYKLLGVLSELEMTFSVAKGGIVLKETIEFFHCSFLCFLIKMTLG